LRRKQLTLSSDDVQELMRLVSQLRGLPSHESKDIYGLGVRLELHTFEIQWANQEVDPSANVVNEVPAETKETFKEVVQSIEAAGRQFAKQDKAI